MIKDAPTRTALLQTFGPHHNRTTSRTVPRVKRPNQGMYFIAIKYNCPPIVRRCPGKTKSADFVEVARSAFGVGGRRANLKTVVLDNAPIHTSRMVGFTMIYYSSK